jgi:hypothetical protein
MKNCKLPPCQYKDHKFSAHRQTSTSKQKNRLKNYQLNKIYVYYLVFKLYETILNQSNTQYHISTMIENGMVVKFNFRAVSNAE